MKSTIEADVSTVPGWLFIAAIMVLTSYCREVTMVVVVGIRVRYQYASKKWALWSLALPSAENSDSSKIQLMQIWWGKLQLIWWIVDLIVFYSYHWFVALCRRPDPNDWLRQLSCPCYHVQLLLPGGTRPQVPKALVVQAFHHLDTNGNILIFISLNHS